MTISERLAFLVTLDADSAIKGFDKVGAAADKGLGKAQTGVDKASKSLVSFGSKALAVGGLAVAGLTNAANAAGDLGEAVAATEVIFGDAADSVLAYGEAAADTIGQSNRAALQAAATFGTFGKAAGKTGEELATFSTDLVTLSSDLASFKNVEPEVAVEALGAALRGESEPIRQFGVLLDDATLKQRALEMGLISTTTGTLPPAIKVQAAYAEILAQTTDAQGDFARTADGLANSQRTATARMEDAKAAIGQGFLPILTAVTEKAGALASGFSDLNTTTNGVASQVLAFGVVGLGAAGAISFLAGKALAAIDNFTKLGGALRGVDGGLSKLGKGVVGLGAVLTVASAVYVGYTSSKKMAEERTKKFADALKLEAEGQKGATAELITAELIQAGVIGTASELGITTEQLARSIRGEEVPALRELEAAFRDQVPVASDSNAEGMAWSKQTGVSAQATYTLFQRLGELTGGFESGTEAVAEHDRVLAEVGGTADTATQAYLEFQAGMMGTAAAADVGTSAYLEHQAGMIGANAAAAESIEIHKRLAAQYTKSRDAIDEMSGSVSRLQDLLSDRDDYDEAIQAQNELIWANTVAWNLAKDETATEEEKAAARDEATAAQRRSIDETLEFIETVGGIPPSKETEIKALIDQGKYDEVERMLANLARARTAFITAKGQGSLGFMKTAMGTSSSPGGMTIVGERGPELLDLPPGAEVRPFPQLKADLSGKSGGASSPMSLSPMSANVSHTYSITVNVAPGGDPASTGRALVEAIQDYERVNSSRWRAS
jgi:hypothetical protein